MAYIEKEPLCAWLENMNVSDFIIRRIKSEAHFPTADVVVVVRCNKCIHCEKVIDQFDNDWYFCKKTIGNAEVKADHFCSYGERREENG